MPVAPDAVVASGGLAVLPASRHRSSIPPNTLQPPISAIPCKCLYSLANRVLPFPMFSPPSAPLTQCSPLLRASSPVIVLTFNFKPSTFNLLSLTPFFATLAASPQLIENPATLSPFAATLTDRVKPKSFACHSYKKHPGVGILHLTLMIDELLVRGACDTDCVEFSSGLNQAGRLLRAERGANCEKFG